MKNPVTKNGAIKLRTRRRGPATHWLGCLGAYHDQMRLVFETDQDLEKAIDLLWTDELCNLPHDTPDGCSIVVPAEAVKSFAAAGLKFSARKLATINDLSPDQIAAMRK